MSYEDIILLVKAGYTRDQIAAMQAPAQTAQAEPTPPAPAEPAQAALAEPAQAAPAEPQAQPKPQGIEDLSNAGRRVCKAQRCYCKGKLAAGAAAATGIC